MPTWPHDRDRLVRSSVPLVNDALAAGRAARPVVTRHAVMTAELEQRLARPMPEEGTREHSWATRNRASYVARVEEVRSEAATLTERWASLMCQVIDTCPERFDDVDYAVWGAEGQPGEVA